MKSKRKSETNKDLSFDLQIGKADLAFWIK